MNETLLYAVRSDLEGIDEGSLYAEFTNEASAIRFAEAHLDVLPYVERLYVSLDDSGNFKDVFKTETVWVYSDATGLNEARTSGLKPLDTPYTHKEIKSLYDQPVKRSTMTNVLYANNTGAPTLTTEDIDTDVIASDKVFQLDFPEYKKTERGPELVADEEEEITFTAEEAVPYLIDDEEEAISSYQKAAEVVDESDLDNKKEILTAIEKIQSEEEEHLDQLKDLVDEEEAETLTEDADLVPYEGGALDSFDDGGTLDLSTGDMFASADGTVEPLYYDADFAGDDMGGDFGMLPYGDGSPSDWDTFKGDLADAGETIGSGFVDMGPSLANSGATALSNLAGAGANAIGALGGMANDIGEVSAMKSKLKAARLRTNVEKADTATARQSIHTQRAIKGAEFQKVGIEKAKAQAKKAAAKGRLDAARIDTQTAKELAMQAPSVANAYADAKVADLQKQTQAKNARTAELIAQQHDDVINSKAAKIAARNQRAAQSANADVAKNLAKQADDVIRATSSQIATGKDADAAINRSIASWADTQTVKNLDKQSDEVRKARSKKLADAENNKDARYLNHAARVKANTTKYKALQDPKVQTAYTGLKVDKIHSKDNDVIHGMQRASNLARFDDALSGQITQAVKLGTEQVKNFHDKHQNPKAQAIKQDVQNTKLKQKLAKEQQKLKDYENEHSLAAGSEGIHEDVSFKTLLPKRTKEYFRMLVNDYKPTPIFTEKLISSEGIKNPFALKKYFVVFNGQGYEVDAYAAEDDAPEAVAYFQTYDEFWDYLREMMSQNGIAPEYNYIFTEGLHESMVVTDAVSLQNATVPTVSRAEFTQLLRENGAVHVYHENPTTFGTESLDYYITITPTGWYELVSEDNRGRIDSEQMFKNYLELRAHLTEISNDPYLYIPDIFLKTF